MSRVNIGSISLHGDFTSFTTKTSGVILGEGKKRCNRCGGILPATVEYFYKNKCRKDGLSHICKECTREFNKEWLKKHPDYGKKYYRNNLEKTKTRGKEYRENNKELIVAMHREWYYNRGGRELAKKRYEKNKEGGK